MVYIFLYFHTAATAKECEEIIQDTLEIFNNPSHESGTTCSAGTSMCYSHIAYIFQIVFAEESFLVCGDNLFRISKVSFGWFNNTCTKYN